MKHGPILVIEDVPNVLELLEVTLRFKGYEVVTARNGKEGLEMVNKANPAMIITDILMPVMDGYAFLQKLRLLDSQIPVIFLSATYVTPEDKDFAMRLGATRFIEKPIETEDFLLTVAEIMMRDDNISAIPLNDLDFYSGYRSRLEQKLHHKNSQIARTERVIPSLPEEQRPAYEAMLINEKNDRNSIELELQEVYGMLEKLNPSG